MLVICCKNCDRDVTVLTFYILKAQKQFKPDDDRNLSDNSELTVLPKENLDGTAFGFRELPAEQALADRGLLAEQHAAWRQRRKQSAACCPRACGWTWRTRHVDAACRSGGGDLIRSGT